MIMHNLFGRFPNLHVLIAEQGTIWLPNGTHVHTKGAGVKDGKVTAAEYPKAALAAFSVRAAYLPVATLLRSPERTAGSRHGGLRRDRRRLAGRRRAGGAVRHP